MLSFIKSVDLASIRFIHRHLVHPAIYRVFTVITCLGGLTFTFGVALFLSIFYPQGLFLFALYTLVVQGIVHSLKLLIKRPRPYLFSEEIIIRKISRDKNSFPSGHAACAFTLAVCLSLFFPSLSIVFYLLAALVSFSRVYLGYHFFGDILISILIVFGIKLLFISLGII